MSRGLIPIPWSRTLTCTESPSWSTMTRTSPPPGEYLIAFPTRLVNICSTLSGSPQTTGRLPGSLVRRVCLAAMARNGDRIRSTTEARSSGRGSRTRRPDSIRETLKRSSISRARRREASRISTAAELLALHRHVPQHQQLGEPVDEGERGPQLVGDGRDQGRLDLVDLPLPGDVADHVHPAHDPAPGVEDGGRGDRHRHLAAVAADPAGPPPG